MNDMSHWPILSARVTKNHKNYTQQKGGKIVFLNAFDRFQTTYSHSEGNVRYSSSFDRWAMTHISNGINSPPHSQK